MNFDIFSKSLESVKATNKWNKIVNIILLICLVISLLAIYKKETVVTIQPFTLDSPAWVTDNNASVNYKESWAYALALIFGNVTPSNIDYIESLISSLLSPDIYQEFINALRSQAQDYKKNFISARFIPSKVVFEKQTNKVFVTGLSYIKGAANLEKPIVRTYEFIINIARYQPVIQYVVTYSGEAKTKAVLEEEAIQTKNQINSTRITN